jgi:hypothetical protein
MVNELLANAGRGLTPIACDTDYAPPRADLVQFDLRLEELESRLFTEDALQNITVSEQCAAACRAEIAEAARKGWALNA